jgi:hypothetical protein
MQNKETKNVKINDLPEPSIPVQQLKEEDFLPSVESVKTPAVLVKDQVVDFHGKTCRVVEVVDIDRFHLKNINQPFDSFIVTSSELE